MTAKPRSSEPRPRKPDLPGDLEERVRERAYQLYDQRGRLDGFALDDWLQAEREILAAEKEQKKVKVAKGSK